MPRVKFDHPRDLIMYVSRGGRTLRVRFDGKTRAFPLVCHSDGWQVRVSGPSHSVKYRMSRLSRSPGFLRVRVFTKDHGRLLMWGRLCVFPTFETDFKPILEHYTINIPVKKILARGSGESVVLFQTYPPRVFVDPSLKHAAWVLFLQQ